MTEKPNPCCNDEDNLSGASFVEGSDGVTMRVCQVCGCRHFELIADRGQYDARGLGLIG